jgi:hypothetical protein
MSTLIIIAVVVVPVVAVGLFALTAINRRHNQETRVGDANAPTGACEPS